MCGTQWHHTALVDVIAWIHVMLTNPVGCMVQHTGCVLHHKTSTARSRKADSVPKAGMSCADGPINHSTRRLPHCSTRTPAGLYPSSAQQAAPCWRASSAASNRQRLANSPGHIARDTWPSVPRTVTTCRLWPCVQGTMVGMPAAPADMLVVRQRPVRSVRVCQCVQTSAVHCLARCNKAL